MSQLTKVWSDDKLLKMINKIIKDSQEEPMKTLFESKKPAFRHAMAEKYEEFMVAYPALFETILNDPKNFEMGRLLRMLDLKKKIGVGDISYEDASSKIGQEYYDEFVKPHVNE